LIIFEGIDDSGAFDEGVTVLISVYLVVVAVYENPGVQSMYDVPEGLKALVTDVRLIVYALGRSVGDEYVEAPQPTGLSYELPSPPTHLTLRVLEVLSVVPERPSQPTDTHTADPYDPVVQRVAALRRFFQLSLVVISRHVEQGLRDHGYQKGEISRIYITAGYDQIDVLPAIRIEVIVQRLVSPVGYCKDSHE
jgi:hypothetical protein